MSAAAGGTTRRPAGRETARRPTSADARGGKRRRLRAQLPHRARLGVALVAALGTVAGGAPGVAALDTFSVENCSDHETICSTLTVTRPTTTDPAPQPPTGGTLTACGPIQQIETGEYVYDVCDAAGNRVTTVAVFPERPRPRPDRSSVVSSAMGALNPPRPTILTSPWYGAGLLVQTPTWLWVPPSYWRTYTTTIMVWGYVVTIYATPTTVRWNMGNGDSITCVGPGTPWLPGLSDVLSTCRYTYRHSSDGKPRDRYKITATVVFAGTFTTTGLGGMRGPLGAVTRSSSVQAEVAEIQGLVTG